MHRGGRGKTLPSTSPAPPNPCRGPCGVALTLQVYVTEPDREVKRASGAPWMVQFKEKVVYDRPAP